jgi:heptose I phosphotransferase
VTQESVWRRLSRGARRLWQRPDWAQFAGRDYADAIMDAAVTDRFHAKQGRSTGRWILSQGDRRLAVYLKRHYRLSWWRGLLALLWPDRGWSPALEEWRHLERARSLGLPVPASVAAGEFIGPGVRLQSFLAVEELTDMLPLHEAVPAAARALPPEAFLRWKRGLVTEVARLCRRLHWQRWFHKDLYLCHFYVSKDCLALSNVACWQGRVHLIDLHRLGRQVCTAWMGMAKDLAQLLYSSDEFGVTARDRVRFWKLYLGEWHRGWFAWGLSRQVLFRWWLYRRHERRRKTAEAR